jgi:nucleoside-diphosphate-sugar epimerase
MHLVIFGLGYTGTALAQQAAAAGLQTTVATRQQGAAAPPGVALAPFDDVPWSTITHLVATAAPEDGGDPVLARHAAAIAAAPALRWIGYMSTTGVYGNRDGGWVDEATDPAPSSERGWRRVTAERAWVAARPDAAVDLLRLAGIYGPGRSVFNDLREGRARRVDKPGHQFGRIHRDDITGALLAAIGQDRPPGPRVLNGADAEPAASADVIAEAASLLGMVAPPLIPFAEALPGMSPMARSFWSDDRKVRSEMTQAWLARPWRYPTYREGLRAILAAEGASPSPVLNGRGPG